MNQLTVEGGIVGRTQAEPVARVHADLLSLRIGPADDVAGAVELG